MNDLLERLRAVDISWNQVGEDCAAAADEIERLNAENARLREAMEEYVNTVVKMEGVTFVEYMENAELRAVVESILAEKEEK